MNKKLTDSTTQPRKGFLSTFRNMRLQTRLILLLLVISVPVLVISTLALTLRAQTFIRNSIQDRLQQANHAIFSKTEIWFRMNTSLVTQLAGMDGIISMDPEKQMPMLVSTTKAFPHLYLAHTLNTDGLNVARNDGNPNVSYQDREYFKQALSGALGEQVIIGRTNNQPALSIGAPIKSADGSVVGVVSVVSDLSAISSDVLVYGSGDAENPLTTFVVDRENQLVAHPDVSLTENVSELVDFSSYPPVVALRQGKTGPFEFVDADGEQWFAYITSMENGWGVITQQNKEVANYPVRMNLLTSVGIMLGGALLLFVVAYFLLRYALRPVGELTEAVSAMTTGDMNREVPVTSEDEIGQLARAFNKMNAQIRDNITSLEDRVAERTRALTLSAEVSRQLSTILELDQLTQEVVDQLKQAFNYYHVHIYLFDEKQENLVMVGGSGEAGRIMQSRGHKIQAGKGLVGRAASTNAPVLVGDTTQDPGWLPNPLLPETRSELAVPIAIGNRVQGVLAVQQNVANGLTQADVDLIQAIAGQVAVAVQNARAYEQVQKQARREAMVSAINQRVQRAVTIDEVLQVAGSELGRGLSVKRASVEVWPDDESSDRKS